jgi:outer membrane protein
MKFLRRRSLILLNIGLCALCISASADAQDATVSPDPRQTAALATQPLSPARQPDGAYTPSNLNRVGVQTAQPLPLSLQEAIRRALEGNNSIEISRGDVRFFETQYRSLLGVYDPVLTAQPTFSRNSTTGGTPTRDFSVNTDLFQFLRPGGGSYQVFFNNRRTENAFAQAQVTSGSVTGGTSALFSSSLGVNYIQPLARNFRVDSRRHQITIARKRLEQSDADFRTLVTDTLTQVQAAYWDFVFALRNQQNQMANVNLAREKLRQVEARIQAGAAAPLERAEVATELANREGELLLATQQVSIVENRLKGLVLRDPLSAEWSQTFVPTDPPAFSLDKVSLEAALADAMDNRFELRSLRLQREANEADIRFFGNQKKPQIDLNTTFSLDGLSQGGTNSAVNTTLLTNSQDIFLLNSVNSTRSVLGLPPIVNPPVTIPAAPSFLFGGFNRSLANIFRTDAPNFSVGVTFSFPLRNRTAKANYDGAKVQEQQLAARTRGQEETVIMEVRNAVQAVETAQQRVLTARRARENAEIQLEGERKLYEAGKSTTFLLFQRENTLNNARNAEIRAETDYNKALADLQRATATAFRVNNITVDEPVSGLR